MRILCVCKAGKNRSVALANALRMRGYRAEAASVLNKPTIRKAGALADLVFVVDYPVMLANTVRIMLSNSPTKPVIRPFLIGKDIWGDPTHPALQEKVEEFLDSLDDIRSRPTVTPKLANDLTVCVLRSDVKKLMDFVDDCARNYDCDADAHTYGTPCRQCDAQAIMDELDSVKEAMEE